MKALVVVLVAVALVLLVGLALRRIGRRASTSPGRLGRGLGDERFLGDTGLVAGREIRERVRGRLFRVITVIMFAVVAGAVIIPKFHTGTTEPQKVAVVAGSPTLNAELEKLATTVGLAVELVHEPDVGAARAALMAGTADVVVDGSGRIIVLNPISSTDTTNTDRYARAVATYLGAVQTFAGAGLTSKQAATVSQAKPLPVESIHPATKALTTNEATALVGVLFIFVFLTQYLTWTLMGVMEEKASRVIEVLLATVRPGQLLAGKVVGIGVVALAQAVALVVFALVMALVVGSNLLHGAAPLVIMSTFVWLILGYAFYSWLYAAAGSMVERQDQVQTLVLPLSAPLIFGYVVSLIGASSGSPSLLVKVLAYLPPTAPFAMPTLVGFGAVAWWQFLLSVALSVICTVLVAVVAARVYRSAVLRTGRRVRLRELVPMLAK